MTGAPAGIQIRPVALVDLEALIDVYLDTAVHHARIDPEVFHVPDRDVVATRLRRRIDGRGETSEDVATFVAGQMAGSASVDLEDPPSTENMSHAVPTAEFGVSVIEAWRGRGIGRALIGYLENWAADHGIEDDPRREPRE